MCQSWVGSIHFAYGRERPRNYYTAACRSRRCEYLGSPPPQQSVLQRLQGAQNTETDTHYSYRKLFECETNKRVKHYDADSLIKRQRHRLRRDLVHDWFPFTFGVVCCHFSSLFCCRSAHLLAPKSPQGRPCCCKTEPARLKIHLNTKQTLKHILNSGIYRGLDINGNDSLLLQQHQTSVLRHATWGLRQRDKHAFRQGDVTRCVYE